MADEILPTKLCRELLGDEAADLTEEDLSAVRECALSLADVVAQAYADFRAEAGDIDPDEIRATGSIGMGKLMGIDIADEELDYPEADLEGGGDDE
jgi:hypothetical protein